MRCFLDAIPDLLTAAETVIFCQLVEGTREIKKQDVVMNGGNAILRWYTQN
jgi:hypothetical protein